MPANSDAIDAVEALLRGRADRGVFRSLAVTRRATGKLHCSFVWLNERPLRAIFDPARGVLEFRDLLPHAPAKSALYKDFRRFIKQRASSDRPQHRRIDPERAVARCRNRAGSVAVSVQTLDGDIEYAVSKALKLVNEIFLGFLRGPYHEYMAANFNEPED